MLPELSPATLRAAARAAAAHRTPFYLFDPRDLRRAACAWRRAAAAIGGEVFYPYKCNRQPEVLGLLAEEAIGAEVTTSADLRRARRLGLSGDRVVVQGPAKDAGLIDEALARGALFVADGWEDLAAILARARQSRARPRYLLRLSAASADAEQRPFGLGARDLLAVAAELARRGEPAPSGLAFHLGTGIAAPAPYLAALREAAAVSRRLSRLGVAASRLDLGGGFAAPSESRLDERGRPRSAGAGAAMLRPIGKLLRRLFGEDVRVLLEPGRALVSGSVHLVTRVLRVKEGRSPTAYLDASRLSHAVWIARGRHPIAAVPRRRGRRTALALAGPLGVGIDVFASAARMPPLEPGDLVVIGSVGAYNQNAASTWAGPIPPVVRINSRGSSVPQSRPFREEAR